jgi:hypothetical protein
MEPEQFLNSVIGGIAVVGAFAVPIAAILITAVIVISLTNKRHLERMKMIEAGIMPPPPRRVQNRYGLLITGAIFFAFGLALLIGELAAGNHDLTGGLIFGFVGLALLACYVLIRLTQKPELPAPGPTEPSLPKTP